MARERHTFSNSEIGHVWFYGRSAWGNGSNMSFDGGTIYSYGTHFPIAKKVYNSKEELAVFYTVNDYSHTTGIHKWRVRSAIPNTYKVFNVPLSRISGIQAHPDQNVHEQVVKYYLGELAEAFKKGTTQRHKGTRLAQLSLAKQYWKNINDYCKFFGITLKSVKAKFPVTAARFAQLVAEATEWNNTHRSNVSIRRGVMGGVRYSDSPSTEQEIARWCAGAKIQLKRSTPVQLRIEDKEVVSSRGARFPVADAIKGLSFIKEMKEKGGWYSSYTNAAGITEYLPKPKLGIYVIDEIKADGTVIAGCHTVPWSSIEKIEQQLLEYSLNVL